MNFRSLTMLAGRARAARFAKQLNPRSTSFSTTTAATQSSRDSLSITDNRNGKEYEIPINSKMIKANDLLQIKLDEDVVGLRSYDPGYMNTASATSKICFIDGNEGLLTYRGYPIEQLAEKSTFMEVSYLLLYGELPTESQLGYFNDRIMKHTFIHEDLVDMMKGFRYDAHPMGMVISTVAAMSTLHPEANPALAGQDIYADKEVRNKQIHRLLGGMPTIAANAYRQRQGRAYVNPSHKKLSYTENFMFMMDRISNSNYVPNPKLAKALDILFILHADHEMNCSTAAMRHLASSGVDVYTALAGATSALYGPRHGGANEAVLRMLEKIGTKENIPQFIEDVKNKKALLMGFGHRVYKNFDPRAKLVKKVAEEVFEVVGYEPLIDLAVALMDAARKDEFFIKKNLYPNVDFFSGVIYRAMGFPTDFYPVLFAIPRTVGWLAHWSEFLDDKEGKIVRPRQNYVGEGPRDYVDMSSRKTPENAPVLTSHESQQSKRRYTSTVAP